MENFCQQVLKQQGSYKRDSTVCEVFIYVILKTSSVLLRMFFRTDGKFLSLHDIFTRYDINMLIYLKFILVF